MGKPFGPEPQGRRLDVEVTRTADSKFGDFSTNVALKASRGNKSFDKAQDKQSPMEFAKVLADSLQKQPYLKKLEVVKPGFINIFIKEEYWQKQVEDVLKQSSEYGSNSLGKGKKARVEFVSANPTGPLHFGNARGGPIGDCLASILELSGYKVIREYLHNDVGGQVAKLGRSIINVAIGQKLENQEYKGEYILDLINKIKKISNFKFQISNSGEAGEKAVEIILKQIIKDTKEMGVNYDKIYHESEFIKSKQTENVLEDLKKKGFLRQNEGATWFAPNDQFLRDRECVVIKSDGDYTYFANDIAYHKLKFAEGYDLVIDILGANHHGHVPRLKAAVDAVGFDPSKFYVILYQWVRFKRGAEVVKMAKRAGTFITAKEVLDEVGRDAVRFFILSHDANSHIDFDLSLASEKSSKNPVYYVQYAYARISSILAKSEVRSQKSEVSYERLTTNYELNLIKQITRLPELVADIAGNFAVHRLTGYAIDLADSFHKFYENCRVIPARNASHSDAGGGEKEDLMRARIGVITATKIALANTLKLLGVSAPEKM